MIISCNECGARYDVPESKAGKTAKCAKCGAAITIPLASAENSQDPADWMNRSPRKSGVPRRAPAPAGKSGGVWIVLLILAVAIGLAAAIVIPRLVGPERSEDEGTQVATAPEEHPAPQGDTAEPEPAPEPVEVETFPAAFGFDAYATDRYLLYCDAPPEVKADLGMRLEVFYDVYRDLVGDQYNPGDAMRANVFFIPDHAAYVAAGGPPQAPGVFIVPPDPADTVGPRLLIQRGTGFVYMELSQLLQHEAWHQFNQLHLQPYSPVWFDEGAATYLSYSIWTGDYVISGSINHAYRHLLSQCIPHFMPLSQLMSLDDGQWFMFQNYVSQNCQAAGIEDMGFWTPYMESWSLIYFLRHANGGQYAGLLDNYISDLVAGRDPAGSIEAIVALENEWFGWMQWFAQQPMATGGRFQEAIVATFTGHLARASIHGQQFNSVDDLIAAAENGALNLGEIGSPTWLPGSVFNEASRYLGFLQQGCAQYGHSAPEFTIETINGVPSVRMRIDSMGINLLGQATISNGQVTRVTVTGLETIPNELR
jgi:predicted Zn finger-like uncharacterized protein